MSEDVLFAAFWWLVLLDLAGLLVVLVLRAMVLVKHLMGEEK